MIKGAKLSLLYLYVICMKLHENIGTSVKVLSMVYAMTQANFSQINNLIDIIDKHFIKVGKLITYADLK